MVKQKTRHLLFEVVWKENQRLHEISQKELTGLIFKEISRLYGPIGTANILPNLAVRFFEARSCLCILRCSRDQQQQVGCLFTSLTFCNPAKERPRLC